MTTPPNETPDSQSTETELLRAELEFIRGAFDGCKKENQQMRALMEERYLETSRIFDRLNLILEMIDVEIDSSMSHAERNGVALMWHRLLVVTIARWQALATPSDAIESRRRFHEVAAENMRIRTALEKIGNTEDLDASALREMARSALIKNLADDLAHELPF